MIKGIKLCLAFLPAALLAGGCAAKKAAVPGAIEGYLQDNAQKYVTLGKYTGLELENFVYEINEDNIDQEIDNRLMQAVEYTESQDPAVEGDIVDLDITITVDGNLFLTERNYSLELGYAMLGFELDDALLGKKAGDEVKFSEKYGEDVIYEEWMNKTVEFDAKILSVTNQNMPALTADYLESLGYDSEDAFRSAIRSDLEERNEMESHDALISDAFDQAIGDCQFQKAPKELSDLCGEIIRTSYDQTAESMGVSLDELYEFYGITADDVEQEIQNEINRRLFISAICEKEDLVLTEDEYKEFLDRWSKYSGYEDSAAMEDAQGKDVMVWNAYSEKVGNYIIENSNVTDTVMDFSDDDFLFAEDPEWEADEVMEGLEDPEEIVLEADSEA